MIHIRKPGVETKNRVSAIEEQAKKRKKKNKSSENVDLVTKAIAGDAQAIERIVELYYPDILSFSIMRVGYTHGEDVAQQAASQIISKIANLKDPAKFRSWMLSIVNRCSSDFFRENPLHNSLTSSTQDFDDEIIRNIKDENDVNPEQTVIDAETRSLVLSALSELPENFRSCLWLFYHEEMSRKEIAKTLDVSVKKVENDLYSAKLKFKEYFISMAGEQKRFDLASSAVLSTLVQTLQSGSLYTPSPDALNLVLQSTQNQLASLAAATATAGATAATATGATATASTATSAAAGGIGLAKTIAIATTAIVASAGIAFGVYSAASSETEPTSENTTHEQALPPSSSAQEEGLVLLEEKRINTLTDMIGEEEASSLTALETQNASQAQIDAFLAHIGAQIEFSGTESDYRYSMYQLQKQDKQLLIITRSSLSSDASELIVQFGEIKELPLALEVVLMFD